MKRQLKFGVAILAAGLLVGSASPHAHAMPLNDIPATLQAAVGSYQRGAASLPASDCSGLVSVAQSLAMGEAPHRLGNTNSLLAGQWPHAIPGATPEDAFVIGVNPAHMVAAINGVNIESTGGPYRVGEAAASPFSPQFRQYHVDPGVLQ